MTDRPNFGNAKRIANSSQDRADLESSLENDPRTITHDAALERTKCWSEFFQRTLTKSFDDGLLRKRQVQYRHSEGSCQTFQHPFINLASNDYLGLSHDAEVGRRVAEVVREFGVGSGASPLVTGYSERHLELEKCLASFLGAEDAVAFSSGFACNAGVIACLMGPSDVLLSDRLNHASLIDGCRLSRAKIVVYPHSDVDYVRNFLIQQRHEFRRALIITESVFSMDGDHAPLRELTSLAAQYDVGMAVDEAHATGIYGSTGAGLADELNVSSQVLVKLGTLSKSIGCVGGYAAGSRELGEFIVNRCRSYIYSTALPGCIASAATNAIQQIIGMQSERIHLRNLSRWLRSALIHDGWKVPDGDSPIIPIIIGDAVGAVELSLHLRSHGFLVPAIRPPTVPEGTARLRISLSVRHNQQILHGLVQALNCSRDKTIG